MAELSTITNHLEEVYNSGEDAGFCSNEYDIEQSLESCAFIKPLVPIEDYEATNEEKKISSQLIGKIDEKRKNYQSANAVYRSKSYYHEAEASELRRRSNQVASKKMRRFKDFARQILRRCKITPNVPSFAHENKLDDTKCKQMFAVKVRSFTTEVARKIFKYQLLKEREDRPVNFKLIHVLDSCLLKRYYSHLSKFIKKDGYSPTLSIKMAAFYGAADNNFRKGGKTTICKQHQILLGEVSHLREDQLEKTFDFVVTDRDLVLHREIGDEFDRMLEKIKSRYTNNYMLYGDPDESEQEENPDESEQEEK